jgi:hypothetical protein
LIPAITDFRACGTIIGPAGLTAVFGMGTGVSPPVWSPEMLPAGGQAEPSAHLLIVVVVVAHEGTRLRDKWALAPQHSARVPSDYYARSNVGIAPGWVLVQPTEAAPRSGWSSYLAVRTGRLKRSPAVHARPIDLVVFQEPTHYCWKPHLGGGFALRCLQRLSGPDLATRRCRERDSRYTRGRSSPILSY